MSQFIHDVVSDMRGGRETWRVFIALCGPALIAALALALS